MVFGASLDSQKDNRTRILMRYCKKISPKKRTGYGKKFIPDPGSKKAADPVPHHWLTTKNMHIFDALIFYR
jgi:hypothetical protein